MLFLTLDRLKLLAGADDLVSTVRQPGAQPAKELLDDAQQSEVEVHQLSGYRVARRVWIEDLLREDVYVRLSGDPDQQQWYPGRRNFAFNYRTLAA